MQRNFTLLLFLCCSWSMWGQQATQYSTYMFNPHAFNPAYAGLGQSLNMVGTYRAQWIGLEGNPVSQNASIHLPLNFFSGGVGLNINNDALGAHRRTQATLSYSQHVALSKTSKLAIGISGGLIQRAYDGTKLRAPEGSYNENTIINHNDDFLPSETISAFTPTFGIGVFYKNEQLGLGIAADNLLESSFLYQLPNAEVAILTKRHFYVYANYRFDIDAFALKPSVLAKSDLNEIQADFSLIISYNDNIFAGASFRGYTANSTDALVIMGGLNISRNVIFAYSYDFSLSPLQTAQTGSHEITLYYNLHKPIGAGIPPKIIYNPRHL